ncbi:uncharacterized protein LOC111327423 [Stylophora pistillata]|uniref:Uncharacterized protein n=1 Tax=Stylophora pistillata TaxID=50429 RepID=A0A2B4SET4_STYPI|nr:uncharacterized protein LOC111327423 [Stylophora pistillata]PFX27563.1 hypothetical protein AWC38_SpisGene7716 [Stylophora pistillata]
MAGTEHDNESLKDHCPAFKEGCPYSKLTEDLYMGELKKCPEFQKGCPFKDANNVKEVVEELSKMPESKHHTGAAHKQVLGMLKAVHSESKKLEEKVGECPVFKTEEGCPFKEASKEGKPLVEPPAAVLEDLTASDVSKLKEKCPAFKEGCPFANVDNDSLLEEIKKCPEFKEGCAFKDAKTTEEIYSKLSQMPSSDKDYHHKEALMETMKVVHSVGHEKAEECPVLQKDGCPFKAVESEGKLLVEPADSVLPAGVKRKYPASDSGCPLAKAGKEDPKK